MTVGFDRYTYEKCYDLIIEPVAKEYCRDNYGVKIHANAKDLIWNNYVKLNRHCREEYMKNPDKLTDRHKVAACYIYAIIKADVLNCSLAVECGDKRHLLLNERLALCFGMSLLKAHIRANAKKIEDEALRKKLLDTFQGEMLFPKTNHGEYRDNLYQQLFHTKSEGNYNILALADSLFLVECYNLVKHGFEEDVFKVNHDDTSKRRNSRKNEKE